MNVSMKRLLSKLTLSLFDMSSNSINLTPVEKADDKKLILNIQGSGLTTGSHRAQLVELEINSDSVEQL